MKKFFSALTALLLSICFISCMADEISDSANSQKEGSVILSIKKARTISPADGISYKDVQVWTVTFKDKSGKYNDIVKSVQFTEANPTYTVQLPQGSFDVIFEGDVTNPERDIVVPFYGKDSVTIEENNTVPKSVFVAPKKSADGKGSFNFTVTTSGLANSPDSLFDAKLIKYPQGETEFLLESAFGSETLSITGNNISSGFYILSIKYKGTDKSPLTEPKEIFYPYYDFLVEIIDGLETKGSADITVSLEDSKTYYATKGETIGNGAFESMPKNLDELLVDINRTTISTANIYIVDEVLTDETSTSYPEIDVSKVNATGKTYCIYTKSEKTQEYNSTPCYTITGAAVEGDEPIIDINSSVRTVTLKNSLSSSGISGRAKIVSEGRPSFVLKDNTSVFIDLTDENNQIAGTTICMPLGSTTFDSYYVENPCVTVKNLSTTQTSFIVYVEQSLSNSYSVVTNSSDDGTYKTTNFYIIPSSTTGLSATGIPNYSLAVTRDGVDVTTGALLYANDTVVITATPAAEATFAQDTTFAWFVNGKQVEANKDNPQSCSIQFGVTEGSGVDNRIICLVGYNGEYATVQTTLTAVEQTALLYTKYGLGYAELASLNANPNLSWILSDAIISDFCIDTKTNDAYIIYADGNPYIEKATYYHANTDMHYASVDYASSFEPNLIRMGNDNKLYVKFSLISDGMAFGIVDLLPNETGTQGAANIPQHLKMSEVSVTDQIMSFCVDDAGIMYITYKDSESNILLAKFSITEGVLTKQNSITLATISNTDNSVTSNYLPANISSNITITDMHYEDGYIYLIVRDVFIDYLTPTDSVRSLGGVCKIKAEDLTLADSTNPLIGWADTQLIITENVYNYKHNEEVQNYFYGPQKIIAIKPKEIVIADDGASIENSKMYQKNRVVLFNLETNSITDVKTSPTEFYFSTSGGDNTAYTPY